MPYHVEIRRARRHARVFNLSEEELRLTVIEPWRHGRPLELGEQSWDRKSRLRILDGPPLEGVDLAYGQGWNHAERTARDVTEELLAATRSAVAVLACTDETADAATSMLAALGVDALRWRDAARGPIREWLTAGERPAPLEFAAAIVVGAHDPPDWWLFETGVALGALGRRAVLVALDGEPPPDVFDELEVLRLDSRDASDLDRLGVRLRAIGVRSAPPEARRAS